MKCLREKDGRDLEDGFPLVESREVRRLPNGYRNHHCPRACHRARNDEVALSARVSSADQKEDLERQLQRLKDYAASKGYHVTRMVSELASGLNDKRPKLMKLLTDPSVGVVLIERRDRLTRFGFNSIEQVMQMQGRR